MGTDPLLTATCRHVSPSMSLELGSPPPCKNRVVSSMFEWQTAHQIALVPFFIVKALISLSVTTIPDFLSWMQKLFSTNLPNYPSRIVPFLACLFFSSTLVSLLRQKEVKTLMGRRITLQQGRIILVIFMLIRFNRLSTTRISIFLPDRQIRQRELNFQRNCFSFASLTSSITDKNLRRLYTAFHLAWIFTTYLTTRGEDINILFFDRSTVMNSFCFLGPPDNCLIYELL